jgi:hypothetical protein
VVIVAWALAALTGSQRLRRGIGRGISALRCGSPPGLGLRHNR